MKNPLVDTKKVSEMLTLTPQQVRNLCRGGKIPCEKIGNTWVMYENDVKNYYDNNACGVAENHVVYQVKNKETRKRPTALSFFSGAMGLDIGLNQAGFHTQLCCEVDNACRKTIRENNPEAALIGDIRDYSVTEIRQYAGITTNDEIDLVIGGPPCQAFSTAGKRKGFEDERGNIFLSFLEKSIALRPKYIVIENVRGLLSAPFRHGHDNNKEWIKTPSADEGENGGALAYILDTLRKAGYGVSFNLYNAANFGTPQKRERVIIICSRNGRKPPYLVPTHSETGEFDLPKWNTFQDAVSGLPANGHHHLEFPEKRLRFYRLLKPGQYWRNLPKELQKEALGASFFAGGGKTGFFRRLPLNEPSPTLVTHPAMPATDLAHPTEDRPLSIEEYKRLQEFPDDWRIEGTLIEQYRQVGNAVPIGLGRAVGRLIIDHMQGKPIPVFPSFPYSRYKNTDEVSWEREFLKKRRQSDVLQMTMNF